MLAGPAVWGGNLWLSPFDSRKSDAVEMDEMMAAMVLTSLSCSPVVQSPPGVEANFSGEEKGPECVLGVAEAHD